jgi:hypothetical protein
LLTASSDFLPMHTVIMAVVITWTLKLSSNSYLYKGQIFLDDLAHLNQNNPLKHKAVT